MDNFCSKYRVAMSCRSCIFFIVILILLFIGVCITPKEGFSESRTAEIELQKAKELNEQVLKLEKEGRYLEAITIAEKILAIYEKALGPEHLDTFASFSKLASLYLKVGALDKAEPLEQRSQAIAEKVWGSEHPTAAPSTLAMLYFAMGAYDKAEPLYQRSLAIYEKALGPEHPDTAMSLNGLAELYTVMGVYDKAEPLSKRSLAIYEKALGPEHLDTSHALNRLAELYTAMGAYDKAEPLFKRSLAIREKTLGPEAPQVGASLGNLAHFIQPWDLMIRRSPSVSAAWQSMRKPKDRTIPTPPWL
jgi:tetratricopeptide (TPR) repeat protein